jgi:hypothetical protein
MIPHTSITPTYSSEELNALTSTIVWRNGEVIPAISIDTINNRLEELMREEGLTQGVISTCALLLMLRKVGHFAIGMIGYLYSDNKHSRRHMWLINKDGANIFDKEGVCRHIQGKSRNRQSMNHDKSFNTLIEGYTMNVSRFYIMHDAVSLMNSVIQSDPKWSRVIANLNKEGLIFNTLPSLTLDKGIEILKILMNGNGLGNACLTSSCIILAMAGKLDRLDNIRGIVGYYIVGGTIPEYPEGTVLPTSCRPSRYNMAITHIWVEETNVSGIVIHDLSPGENLGYYSLNVGDADHLDLDSDNIEEHTRFKACLDKVSVDSIITDWITPLQIAVNDKEEWKWILADLTNVGLIDPKILEKLGVNTDNVLTMLDSLYK